MEPGPSGPVAGAALSAQSTAPARALITPPAADLLRRLRAEHGPLMLHQSGGCCDGSSPMLYPAGDFIVGDRDVLLGVLLEPEDGAGAGVPLWISGPQFELWRHTQLVLDVVEGRGGGFSLEALEGVRLLTRGRAFDPVESAALAGATVTGADVEAAGLPHQPGPTVVDAAHDPRAAALCRIPAAVGTPAPA